MPCSMPCVAIEVRSERLPVQALWVASPHSVLALELGISPSHVSMQSRAALTSSRPWVEAARPAEDHALLSG